MPRVQAVAGAGDGGAHVVGIGLFGDGVFDPGQEGVDLLADGGDEEFGLAVELVGECSGGLECIGCSGWLGGVAAGEVGLAGEPRSDAVVVGDDLAGGDL